MTNLILDSACSQQSAVERREFWQRRRAHASTVLICHTLHAHIHVTIQIVVDNSDMHTRTPGEATKWTMQVKLEPHTHLYRCTVAAVRVRTLGFFETDPSDFTGANKSTPGTTATCRMRHQDHMLGTKRKWPEGAPSTVGKGATGLQLAGVAQNQASYLNLPQSSHIHGQCTRRMHSSGQRHHRMRK